MTLYRFRALPLVLYCIMIFIISAQSRPPVPDLGFVLQDKVYHLVGYFVFGVLSQLALTGRGLARRQYIVATIIIGAVYAFSDEWHQSFVPGRSSEFADWIADVIGVTCSLTCANLLQRLLKQ